MKFWEAMKALEAGRMVTCKSWADDPHCRYTSKTTGRWIAIEDFSDEWELYEDLEKTLSFAEVVKGLKEGNEYRRKSWPNEGYSIKLYPPGIINGQSASPWFCYPEDFEATDWVEVN